MITLQQAQKVPYGEQLDQADVDEANKYGLGLDILACWAKQYYYERNTDAKAHDDFCRNAY